MGKTRAQISGISLERIGRAISANRSKAASCGCKACSSVPPMQSLVRSITRTWRPWTAFMAERHLI